MSLFVDDVITLRAEFRDSGGSLITPTAVSFKVQTPSGTVTTISGGSVSNPSTGVYTASYTIGSLGRYQYWAIGTGSNAKTAFDTFTVTGDAPE